MKHHENESGRCLKCQEILDRYPGFHEELRIWFEAIQVLHPDCHCSAAGRGSVDQEAFYQRKASKAHYGQSAHNYNAAVDLFQLKDGKAVWDTEWFDDVIGANLYAQIVWYGESHSVYRELPHCEIADWKELVFQGKLKLVEPI